MAGTLTQIFEDLKPRFGFSPHLIFQTDGLRLIDAYHRSNQEID